MAAAEAREQAKQFGIGIGLHGTSPPVEHPLQCEANSLPLIAFTALTGRNGRPTLVISSRDRGRKGGYLAGANALDQSKMPVAFQSGQQVFAAGAALFRRHGDEVNADNWHDAIDIDRQRRG